MSSRHAFAGRAVVIAAGLVLSLAGCDAGGSSADPPAAPSTVGTRRTDDHAVAQVRVPAGSFQMGTSDDQAAALTPPDWAAGELASEQPQHAVTITRDFWIDTHEVSNAAFQAFVDAGGYADDALWSADGLKWLSMQHRDGLPRACVPDAPPDHPRVCVTWFEAEAYARWRGGRLPTEAEWEYAARGPKSSTYPWGDAWDASKANVVDSAGLTPVGHYPAGASWVGALDMAGNAMEWVGDWLDDGYYAELAAQAADGAAVDPTGPAAGTIKVEKGGWWGSTPYNARAAYRHFEDNRSYQDHHIGFRVVTDVAADD